jgi:3-ketosteroid 9alpha-monooxygenase subunit B
LASAHSERLQIVHWLDSVQGVPSVSQLAELARPWRDADCYICGPELFMDASIEALHQLGLPSSRIHVERFVSLPDEEEGPAAVAAESGGSIHLEVELDGERYELTCSDQEPLLDAMLRAGIKAPHSCRSGACGSCMCTIESGEVHLRRNQVLNANDLKEHWILACQAIADTPNVKIRFPD